MYLDDWLSCKFITHVPYLYKGVVVSSTGLPTVHHNATQPVLGANTFTRLIPRCLLVLLFILSLSLIA